jgi:CRISPR-associated protein, csn2 family
MKITISYLENNVEITNDFINVLEIENKKVFFRLINDLNQICNGNVIEEIKAFSDDKEINITNKVNVISDFFNIDFSKYMLSINKLINENLKDNSDKSLLLLYKKLIQKYNSIISTVDLPIAVNNDATIESLTKLFKLKVNYKNSIIENLFSIIELERSLKSSKFIVLVNLKQYLDGIELNELYKYSIYNNVNVILIDSQCYGCSNDFEKKLIVDNNLVEFVVK